MPRYLMKYSGEIIQAKDFNELRQILKDKLNDDCYVRKQIKGVGADV